jgi:UDP-GlcNAc:undecaprenyl-phosphate GlcNAc-1-phosphate transferase
MPIIIVLTIAFLLNVSLTPLLIRLSRQKGWFDRSDKRKIHNGNIPRIGGIGIAGSFYVTLVLAALIFPFSNSIGTSRLVAACAGSLLMFGTGLLDDFKNIRARHKLLLQIIAAGIAVAGGLRFGQFATPFGFNINIPIFSIFLTLLWIVGVTNAVNLIDGMDGLAGGISAIASGFWLLILIPRISGNLNTLPHLYLIPATLLGSLIGFLVYNKPPASIFMGDSGSLVLGYLLSLFPFFQIQKAGSTRWLFIGITLLLVPILDTLAAILRRIREKRSIGEPDRSHIHHKLLDLGWTVPRILGMIYGFSIFTGCAAFLWTAFPALFPIFLLPVAWIPTVALFLVIHFKNMRLKHF